MKEKMIKGLKIEPHKHPEYVTVENELKALQAQVGGLIEVITLSPTAAIIINDEGKLIGLEGNRRFRNDVIVGNMLIVGVKD